MLGVRGADLDHQAVAAAGGGALVAAVDEQGEPELGAAAVQPLDGAPAARPPPGGERGAALAVGRPRVLAARAIEPPHRQIVGPQGVAPLLPGGGRRRMLGPREARLIERVEAGAGQLTVAVGERERLAAAAVALPRPAAAAGAVVAPEVRGGAHAAPPGRMAASRGCSSVG